MRLQFFAGDHCLSLIGACAPVASELVRSMIIVILDVIVCAMSRTKDDCCVVIFANGVANRICFGTWYCVRARCAKSTSHPGRSVGIRFGEKEAEGACGGSWGEGV